MRLRYLQVSSTNNDPAVVARYYLNCIEQLGFVPKILRCDLGTENTNLEFLQPFFRQNCNDDLAGVKSFMHGKSTSNQRIEAWWAILRRQCTDWWICLFKDFRDRGIYNDLDPIHEQCIKFCFMDVLQKELYQVATEWNIHHITSKMNHEGPAGKPDVMYYTPTLYDAQDYGFPVNRDDVSICKDVYSKEKPNDYTPEFMQLVGLLRPNLDLPTAASNAVDLYTSLINDINEYTN